MTAVFSGHDVRILLQARTTQLMLADGIVGLVSSILLVYVLSGIYFLIADMDKPLDFSDDSFIDVRIDALEFFNEVNKK